MTRPTIDVLMITYNRAAYTARSLAALLESCDEAMRVWVWQNGSDPDTFDVVRSMLDHPRLHRFHHSPTNELVRKPTNWLLEHARGDLLGVVADDCVVSRGWADHLRAAHAADARYGVLACWHFHVTDFDPRVAAAKTRTSPGGQRVLAHPWVQGSGVLVKRACVEEMGLLPPADKGFTGYCIRLANRGWINGWPIPLIPIDHMDDPRSPHTQLRTDDDLEQHLPLSARLRGTRTIAEWTDHLRRSARIVQEAPNDPRVYVGVRKKLRRVMTRLRREPLYY
jgi:GT2 family glycosyltransferase